MSEAFCIHYRDLRRDPPALRVSRSYLGLDLASESASQLARQSCEPVAIRGSDGTVIAKDKLASLLAGRESADS